jgi:hypothetical protein
LFFPSAAELAPSLSAQTPTRTTPNRETTATGVIRGRITAADTGRPLRRSQVTATAPELGAPRRTNTSLDGRYEFRDLPAGRYTISVTRSGYLSLRYGQRRPMEQARPLQLEDKQTLSNIDLVLPRMGVITGRVLDDAGEPIAGVLVQALRPAWVEGRRQLVIAAMAFGPQGTDETGQYRLTGLPPGSYYVRASTRETWTVSLSGKRELMGFAPTYFPATVNASEARLVEVGVGQRVINPDILLIPGRPANISGLAFDSQGRPLAGRTVGLTQRFLRETPGGGGSSAGSMPVSADGSFTFRNVTPGEYQLGITTGDLSIGEGEIARLNVVIDGTDLDNVRLTTTAGWSVAGRIVTEDGQVPTFARDAVRVGATTLLQVSVVGVGIGEVKDDWTFSVRTIIGAARLWANVPDGWMVKAVRREDRDITSALLELRSGESLSDVEVIVTNRITTVTGQLADDRGQPLSNGTVVIFSEDTDRWGETTAFVRTTRPDQDGKYEIRGLPAGDYLALALDYVQDGIWNDPEFLESVRRYAQRFTLIEGGSHALSLKVTKP